MKVKHILLGMVMVMAIILAGCSSGSGKAKAKAKPASLDGTYNAYSGGITDAKLQTAED